MPLSSQSSENQNQEPSITRWSFQDFEQAYEMKFASKWIKTSSVAADQHVNNVNSDPQQLNGLEPSQGAGQNGHSRRDEVEAGLNNSSNTAIYEQYLTQDKVANGANGVANGKANGKWPPKLLPEFASAEMRELAESITRDIVRDTADVQWDTIKGLESAKKLLKEAVVMPIKYPQYFTGLLTPWKGILLFGPPGTGKVLFLPHCKSFGLLF